MSDLSRRDFLAAAFAAAAAAGLPCPAWSDEPSKAPEGRSPCRIDYGKARAVPTVCIDVAYSETAALADVILAEATALERWNAQTTNAWDLVPVTGIRQPVVEAPPDVRSVWWIYRELARRLGPEAYQYWDFPDEEAFYRAWYAKLPIPWEEFKHRGVWYDPARPRDYELFERELTAAELEGAQVDEMSGLVTKEVKGKRTAVGIRMGDRLVRGFPSPSRRIEVEQDAFVQAAAVVGLLDHAIACPLPTWFPNPAHAGMKDGELKFVTFKWNVHTQGRTAHHKYQAEIVHGNPVWIGPETAASLGLEDGDLVEVTIRRPAAPVWGAGDGATGAFRQRVRVVPGVARGVLACSHHLGHWEFGRVGSGRLDREPEAAAGMEVALRGDRDIPDGVWWARSKGGVGTGVAINDAMPIAPTPLSGGQAWYDWVCRVRKV